MTVKCVLHDEKFRYIGKFLHFSDGSPFLLKSIFHQYRKFPIQFSDSLPVLISKIAIFPTYHLQRFPTMVMVKECIGRARTHDLCIIFFLSCQGATTALQYRMKILLNNKINTILLLVVLMNMHQK